MPVSYEIDTTRGLIHTRCVGPVTLDQDERRVAVDGRPVKLTFSEYELLARLMSRPESSWLRPPALRGSAPPPHQNLPSIAGEDAHGAPRGERGTEEKAVLHFFEGAVQAGHDCEEGPCYAEGSTGP